MNENIDLTKVLDGCPKGTEFYSDTFGILYFNNIRLYEEFPILFSNYRGAFIVFDAKGKYYSCQDSRCKLSVFPSDSQRDWSKFERFWDKPKIERFNPKTLKPFDKVLVRNGSADIWQCEMFSHFCLSNPSFPFFCCGNPYHYCIPYNSETEHLLGTCEETPEKYRYW